MSLKPNSTTTATTTRINTTTIAIWFYDHNTRIKAYLLNMTTTTTKDSTLNTTKLMKIFIHQSMVAKLNNNKLLKKKGQQDLISIQTHM